MPIKYAIIKGEHERDYPNESGDKFTVIIWHDHNLRFILLELSSLLYGVDIENYAKSLELQLQTNIPTFEQLLAWIGKIDPKTAKADFLLGQLFEKDEAYLLQLQSSSYHHLWLKKDKKYYKLAVSRDGLSGELKSQDELLIGSQSLISRLGQLIPDLNSDWKIQLEEMLKFHPRQKQILLVNILRKPRKIDLSWIRKIKLPAFKFKKVDRSFQSGTNIDIMTVRRPVQIWGKRKFALILAISFLALLTISIGLGINKRKEHEKMIVQEQLIENVKYRLEQAKSLQELNPSRAKTLLAEARQSLEEYKQKNELSSELLKNLEKEVATAHEQVSGLIIIGEAPLYYNPYLLKDGFEPTEMSLSDEQLSLLDRNLKLVGLLSLENKSAKIIAGESVVKDNSRMASIVSWIFLISGNNLAIIDKDSQERIKSYNLSKTTVSDVVGYGSNLYILDIPSGMVSRFRGQTDGLSKAEDFFDEKQDLEGAVSLAVDGSVWILYQNGSVEKYTSGVRDALFTEYGLDQPIKEAKQLYTNENLKNLYILDSFQGRVIAISKNGEFIAEYSWDGLKQCDDFVVDEEIGQILVLKDAKIWGINLK